MRIRINFLFLIQISLLVGVPSLCLATESICPGGRNPRPDISWCGDHENFSSPSCIVGNESECMQANGHIGTSDFMVKTGDAAIGNGSLVGTSEPGGTGPGYLIMPDQTPSLSASLRFYVKFNKGYLQSSWNRGNHGPSLQSQGSECSVRYSLDWSNEGPSFILQSACSDTILIPSNIVSNTILKNNRWYLIEMQATMNTTTSGSGGFDGNGILRAYIDGQKILEYTNINLRGNSNEKWYGGYTARSYYSLGTPSWSGELMYDGFAYSKTGEYIGPSIEENPRGTADIKSPYLNFASYNGFVGSKMSNDCSSPGSSLHFTPLDESWRNQNASRLSSEVAHNAYTNRCAPEYQNSPQIVVQRVNDTSRNEGSTISPSNTLNITGKVFLPSTGTYLNSPRLLGFFKPSTQLNNLGVSTSGGKWTIIQTIQGATSIIKTSTTTAQLNSWNNIELSLSRSSIVTLKVNNQTVIASFSPTVPPTWAWDDIGGKVSMGALSTPSLTSDKSLKIHLTSKNDGGGVVYAMAPSASATSYAIHGWIYLPTGNDYSSPVALSGFSRYAIDSNDNGGASNWGNYLAVGISQGKWGVVQRNGSSPFVAFESNVNALPNTWYEFEIFVEKEGVVSLMINREWVVDEQTPSSSISWIWDDHSGGPRSLVVGIVDFRGTPPMTAFFDDVDVLSASAWSCKGWTSESCPNSD